MSYWDIQKTKISFFYPLLQSMKPLNQLIAILIIFSQDILIKIRQKNILFNWSHLKNGKEDVGGCKPPRRNTCCSCKWSPT